MISFIHIRLPNVSGSSSSPLLTVSVSLPQPCLSHSLCSSPLHAFLLAQCSDEPSRWIHSYPEFWGSAPLLAWFLMKLSFWMLILFYLQTFMGRFHLLFFISWYWDTGILSLLFRNSTWWSLLPYTQTNDFVKVCLLTIYFILP